MHTEIISKIERELDDCVRPMLGQHGGNIQVISFDNGLLKLRMLGGCANCPSAVYENEQIFEGELKSRIAEIDRVIIVTGVSDDLINSAKSLMKNR